MNRKIKEIEDKRNNGGKLTDKEVKDLESLYKQRQEIAVKALSNGEKEQQRILTRMSINRKAVSVEDASETVKEANKARDDAKKMLRNDMMIRLTKLIQWLDYLKKKEKLLKEAKDKYDNEKQLADKTMIKL